MQCVIPLMMHILYIMELSLRLSLIGLDTIVHRPCKMAMEDMVNVCTRYILFNWSVCVFGGFVGEGATTHQRLPL